MRQTISVKVVGNMGEILVSLLVGILVALCLENAFAILETASKHNLRTRLCHCIVGQGPNTLVAGFQVICVC